MDMEMEMEKRRANSGRSRGSSSGTYLFGQRLLSCVLCLVLVRALLATDNKMATTDSVA
jgi:hypothetical protein